MYDRPMDLSWVVVGHSVLRQENHDHHPSSSSVSISFHKPQLLYLLGVSTTMLLALLVSLWFNHHVVYDALSQTKVYSQHKGLYNYFVLWSIKGYFIHSQNKLVAG